MESSQERNGNRLSKQKVERKLRKEIKGTDTKETLDKYKNKKELNALATRYADTLLSVNGLERFGSCGDWLQFATTENYDATKLYKANFCMHRFCPMCNMRKAVKDAMALGVVLESLERDEYEFLFLTLTVPNCSGDELPAVLDAMNTSAKNMFQKKKVKGSIKGYVRKVEVTTDQVKTINKSWYKKREEYCQKRNLNIGDLNPNFNTYHPHMHFILVVEKEYFRKHSNQYIPQAEWAEMWREVTGKSNVIVDIRKVQTNNGQSKAVEEIAKYSAKDSDLYYSESVFATFYIALRGRKLLTTSGIANERMKAFKSGELDYILEEQHEKRRETQKANGETPHIYTKLLNASWVTRMTRNQRKVMDYALRINDMTDEQINEFNNVKDLELAIEMSGE